MNKKLNGKSANKCSVTIFYFLPVPIFDSLLDLCSFINESISSMSCIKNQTLFETIFVDGCRAGLPVVLDENFT